MNVVKRIIVGITMSITTTGAFAQKPIAVEWAPFIKLDGVSDAALVSAADKVNSEFLAVQPGFLKRELVKKSETEYADIIHWSTNEHAVSAGSKVEECAVCANYFKLMDMESSASAGAGFSHYTVLKVW